MLAIGHNNSSYVDGTIVSYDVISEKVMRELSKLIVKRLRVLLAMALILVESSLLHHLCSINCVYASIVSYHSS